MDTEKTRPLWCALLSWISGSETQELWGVTPTVACLSLEDAQVTIYRPAMIKDPPMMLPSHGCKKKQKKINKKLLN